MNLKTREAEDRDIPEIKRLIDVYIAEDYYSLQDVKDSIHGEQNLFYVVTDEDRGGAIISFFYAVIAPLDEALRILHVKEKPEALRDVGGETSVGVYKTASTEKEYQKLGICSSFIRGLEPVIRERGGEMILATALHPLGQEVPMRHIFHDNGFTPVQEIERPWVEMTLYCPYCKRNHCICNAVFYLKELTESEGNTSHDES